MARLIGTGKDPRKQYAEGVMFDVPEFSPLYQELIDKGFATAHDGLVETEAELVLSVANGLVRSDTIAHPVESKVADKIDGNEYAIVHEQDPAAKGTGQPEDLKGAAKKASEAALTTASRQSASNE